MPKDIVMTLKQIREVIELEIKWHKKMKGLSKKSKDWESGFLTGMKQIKQLFKNENFASYLISKGKKIPYLKTKDREELCEVVEELPMCSLHKSTTCKFKNNESCISKDVCIHQIDPWTT